MRVVLHKKCVIIVPDLLHQMNERSNYEIFYPPLPLPIPTNFTAEDIKIESSTCTGEKTIGFYDKLTKKLMYAELVRSEKDVQAFCTKYGVDK